MQDLTHLAFHTVALSGCITDEESFEDNDDLIGISQHEILASEQGEGHGSGQGAGE